MKKLSFFLALVLVLAACGGTEPAAEPDDKTTTTTTTTTTTSPQQPPEPPNPEICKDCEKEPCVCVEEPNSNPDARINTDLLDEFGMTLSELEKSTEMR